MSLMHQFIVATATCHRGFDPLVRRVMAVLRPLGYRFTVDRWTDPRTGERVATLSAIPPWRR